MGAGTNEETAVRVVTLRATATGVKVEWELWRNEVHKVAVTEHPVVVTGWRKALLRTVRPFTAL